MNKGLQEEKEKLDLQEQMLEDTCNFWSDLIQRKYSRYVFVSEKLKEQWSDELLIECEQLEKEIKHLNLKKDWELKENERLKKQKDIFDKKQKKDFMFGLSSKLSKNPPPQKSS